jgi:hypothetical protein
MNFKANCICRADPSVLVIEAAVNTQMNKATPQGCRFILISPCLGSSTPWYPKASL